VGKNPVVVNINYIIKVFIFFIKFPYINSKIKLKPAASFVKIITDGVVRPAKINFLRIFIFKFNYISGVIYLMRPFIIP